MEENQANTEEQSEVVAQETFQESQESINWKQANEVMRLQRMQIEQLEARLSQPAPQQVQEIDEFANLDKSEYVTVEKALEIGQKISAKQTQKVKAELEGVLMQQRIAQSEERMRSQKDDYDYVVDNFVLPFLKTDPVLAHRIQTSNDPAKMAYKLGKTSDEYEAASQEQQTSPRAAKILKNSSRPVPSAAAGGVSLKTQAEDFSKMNPAQVWELSQQYANKV